MMKESLTLPPPAKLPKHVAIIMDGNGRWAKEKGLSRLQGHQAGLKSALEIIKHCSKIDIPYLTLYAFSSENWQRPDQEILGLMNLLYNCILREGDNLKKNGVRLSTIGEIQCLPEKIQMALSELCHKTVKEQNLHLTLALSYGARDELTRAVKKITEHVCSGSLKIEAITEQVLESYLDTCQLPDPDLLIRTAGEARLSNFLLWQLSYTELYFSPIYWPDFSLGQLNHALHIYANRERKFGNILITESSSIPIYSKEGL